MKNIKFKECNVEIAKDQPEYKPLYACYDYATNIVTTCYKFNLFERLKFLFTGKLWLMQMTFGNPLQPQLPTINKNDIYAQDEYIREDLKEL